MTERITKAELEELCDQINLATGSPMKPWAPDETGRMRGQVGNFHLYWAYGGVCLHRMHNESGGISTPLISYTTTKRDLWNRMRGFLSGLSFESN